MSDDAFSLATALRYSVERESYRKAARAARMSARSLALMGEHARAAESLEAAARYEGYAREVEEKNARRQAMAKANNGASAQWKQGTRGRAECTPNGSAKLRYNLAKDALFKRAAAHAAMPSDEEAADALTRACIELAEAEAAFRSLQPRLTAIVGGG